ncbi:MAG: UbiD family decarboxylase, partial [Taibaiella sp.]|nr:UbiD family decarboxylase [Taibaiella sp.]
MAYKSLRAFIDKLEAEGELVRISSFVDPVLEIAEITDRVSKTPDRNKALLFENTGTEFPLLINGMGSEKRMCIALGVSHLDEIAGEIEGLFKMMTGPKNGLLD